MYVPVKSKLRSRIGPSSNRQIAREQVWIGFYELCGSYVENQYHHSTGWKLKEAWQIFAKSNNKTNINVSFYCGRKVISKRVKDNSNNKKCPLVLLANWIIHKNLLLDCHCHLDAHNICTTVHTYPFVRIRYMFGDDELMMVIWGGLGKGNVVL